MNKKWNRETKFEKLNLTLYSSKPNPKTKHETKFDK